MIILLIPIGLASAETGKNYDTESLGNGLIQWTSHYDRIFDGDSWENYLISNNPMQLEFESANLSFIFDKASCNFKLLNPESETVAIDGYDFTLNIDGLPSILPICDLESFIQSEDKVSFTINRGLFKTLYDMNPSGSMEWTHEIDNNEGKASTFTIIETCTDCIAESIEENKIDFGFYTLDTKNEVHNTVKETRADKGDYIIEYEKTIPDGEKLIIDPVFSYTVGTSKRVFTANAAVDPCSTTASASDAVVQFHKGASGAAGDGCDYLTTYWNIASIPNLATITDTDLLVDVDTSTNPENCDINPMTVNPSSASIQAILDDIIDGTPYLDNNNWCTTVSNNKAFDLGASADTDVTTALADNEFAIGFFYNSLTRTAGVTRTNIQSDIRLQVTYFTISPVNDLVILDTRPTSVDLDWSQPALNGNTLSGYQINYTTPWSSNVATIRVNNTANSATAYTIQGLAGSTQYSFRIGVWSTFAGDLNAGGNVANTTTDFDPTASFSTGTFSTNFTGTDVREIFYTRDDINATALFLNVTATNTIELNCNFYYKFAMTNDTFTNIANTSISATRDMASFRFLHVDNEIIDVLCWDQYDNQTNARYVITQTTFPFLEQIANFRNGTYGTMGMFGALDFISMIAVICSMIGFNRVNETVGIIFGLFMIGALAVLSNGEIISWASTFTVGFAVLVMWAISTTRKD